MRRRTIVIVVAVVVVLGVPAAAYAYLVWSTRDAPEPASLAQAPTRAAGCPTAANGTWVPADAETSYVGYRIRERIGPVSSPSDAVGRSRALTGALTIKGPRLAQLDITVDMTELRSDSSRRDEILRDASLQTGVFPTASFTLDQPVDIGPPRRGRAVERRVPGELTVHGVTRNATFEVQARWNGPTIQAAGTTRIEPGDFGVETSGLAGFSVAGTATVEFELTLAPEGAATETTPSTLVNRPETSTASDDVIPCRADGGAPALRAPVLVTTSTGGVVMIVSGSGQTSTPYTSPGWLEGASWNPDGSAIVFAGSPTQDPDTALATVPAAGGTPVAVPGLRSVAQPDWGPDGLVFVQDDETGGTDLWVADADGSDARRLVATPGVDREPRWSPDGRRIVFSSLGGTSSQDLMLVEADGTGLRRVARTRGYEYAPSFSPDGRNVLFVRDGAIRRIGLHGRRSRKLTAGPDDANPALSPDGSQLAFVRAGSLYVAAADGAQPRCVQTDVPIGGGPRWRP